MTTEPKIYVMARPYCPLRSMLMFSIEKAENVVNPPQNPVKPRQVKSEHLATERCPVDAPIW